MGEGGESETDATEVKNESTSHLNSTELIPTKIGGITLLREINWKPAGKDAYYRARQDENKARVGEGAGNYKDAVKYWLRYAKGKGRKGSLLLETYGHINVARNYEKMGNWKNAATYYQKASENAEKLDTPTLSIIPTLLNCLMYYVGGYYKQCIGCYEKLGGMLYRRKNYFLSADAYEHAAEVMYQMGMDTEKYLKPVSVWRRNARYWREQGNADDAEWSLRRIELYRKLFRK
jgi:tetratricopeptide (TPR) repeat protein